MNLKVFKLFEDSRLPTKATEGSAGFDLYAHSLKIYWSNGMRSNPREAIKIDSLKNGDRIFIGTGIAIEFPLGYFGILFGRSGLAIKNAIGCGHHGVIDTDYRGEVGFMLDPRPEANPEKNFVIQKGDRIGQIVLLKNDFFGTVEEIATLGETDRGQKGFGSSGL